MARAAMVFKSTIKNYSGSILLPKTENELLKPDSLKHHLMENRTLKLMVWAVSEKKLIAEGHSKKAALRFSDSSRKGSINHHDKLEKLE